MVRTGPAGGWLTAIEYNKYVRSSHWERRRLLYYANHAKICAACGHTKRIHLHHKRYDNLWEELDSDLVPLCERCHSEVHRRHEDQHRQSLAEVTDNYITFFRGTVTRKRKRDRERDTRTPKVPVTAADRDPSLHVPHRQRLTTAQRRATPTTGAAGRLGGLPIVRVPEPKRTKPKPKAKPKTQATAPPTTTLTKKQKRKRKAQLQRGQYEAMKAYWAASEAQLKNRR